MGEYPAESLVAQIIELSKGQGDVRVGEIFEFTCQQFIRQEELLHLVTDAAAMDGSPEFIRVGLRAYQDQLRDRVDFLEAMYKLFLEEKWADE